MNDEAGELLKEGDILIDLVDALSTFKFTMKSEGNVIYDVIKNGEGKDIITKLEELDSFIESNCVYYEENIEKVSFYFFRF